jgi:HD-GYP domain-containing protein (c-di-GMP phosphodiesterase class II)
MNAISATDGRKKHDVGASRVRFPLHITLGAVFATVLIAFGTAIIGFSYVENRRIALLGAEALMARISAHTRTKIEQMVVPAQGLVDLYSRSLAATRTSPEDRLESLGVLAEALRLQPAISSIFMALEDGDFFLVRSLASSPAAASRLNAPQGSRFAVQSIERAAGETLRGELLFYDDELNLLESGLLETIDFDPRQREWYREALATEKQITTDFYVFYTTGEVGFTLARRMARGNGVVGVDLTLRDLSSGLAQQRVTPSTRIAVVDDLGRVVALSEQVGDAQLLVSADGETVEMPRLSEMDDPVYQELAARLADGQRTGSFVFSASGRSWIASLSLMPTRRRGDVVLATVVPRDEILAHADQVRNRSIAISLLLMAVAIVLVLWISHNISRSMRGLAREAEQIRRFKLNTPVSTRSRIAEVDELGRTMAVMKDSLSQFFAISQALSAEKDPRRVLEMILREACKVSHADGGAVQIVNADETALEVAILENTVTGAHFGGTSGVPAPLDPVRLNGDSELPGRPGVDAETVRRAETISIDDLWGSHPFDVTAVRNRFDGEGYQVRSLLSVPLADQKGEVVGLLQLVNARSASGEPEGFDPDVVPFIEALSSDAAVTLDLRRLLKAQKDLLESFIHVVAGAIDAKSPYTHGHCQRVPVLTQMLAEVAHNADEGPLRDFKLTEDERYELHIASWLHDCGKVTTPEYVVDKATRLETIHNRIHEIRTRFEVLWRDAEIEYHRELIAANGNGEALERRLEERLEQIRDDFDFIARCNLGETFMSEENVDRVRRIAEQSWLRHLDDRLGLSHEELARKQRRPEAKLPAVEELLADKVEHVIERQPDQVPFGDNHHGFSMDMPEHLYNHGEIFNLCIERGTLTDSERFKINEHVVQTINMLGRLPFPKELRRVPEWAGNHHEKLDGTGYPRRLAAADLSTTARILAVADIFEALTASDRPYMRPKTLSTAIHIMSSMRDGGHICPDLFEIFLTSGAYLEYGKQYLKAEQLDEVDIEKYVGVRV